MSTRGRGAVSDRARADLRAGRTTTARTRLKSYLVNVPRSMPARALLAPAYRLDDHLDEAGRWGYLSPMDATPAEPPPSPRTGARSTRPTPSPTATESGSQA